MPMLKPKKTEDKGEFVTRFMGNAKMVEEYPDIKQRAAIAYNQWRQGAARRNLKENEMDFRQLKSNLSGSTRFEKLEGKKYLVAPLIMLTEGVHNGSGGAAYYPPEEMRNSAKSWNHKPVTLFHPELNGMPISASDPVVLEKQRVGFLLNSRWDDKLKAEAWLDEEKCLSLDKDAYEDIKANKMLEVSTGLYTDDIMEKGEWEGESFDRIAFNHQPDHLALLPGRTGACSIKDGAGIPRLNEDGTKVKNNELTFEEIRVRLQSALRERFPKTYIWVLDILDGNKVIFESDNLSEQQSYRMGFATTDESVTLSSAEPVIVERFVKYKPVTSSVNNKRSSDMERKERIDALIANGMWAEEDRDFLADMDEKYFEKLSPVANTEEAKNVAENSEEAVIENVEGKVVVASEIQKLVDNINDPAPETPEVPAVEALVTMESYIENAPTEFKEFIVNGVNMLKAKKDDLVAKLVANEKCLFSEDQLKAKDVAELEILTNMAVPATNYAAQAPVASGTVKKVEGLPNPWKESK